MIAEGKDKLEWYRQVDPAKLNTLKELIASPNYKVGSNFLSISPNQTMFLPAVCLVPAGLFCHSKFLMRIFYLPVYLPL
jgi:hypothetical protein